MAAFLAGAIAHGLAAAVFAVVRCASPNGRANSIATSALIVALLTAALNGTQALGGFASLHESYTATWAVYTLCLFFIGKSLTVATGDGDWFTSGFVLALVGAGGVFVLELDDTVSIGAYAVAVVGIVLLYVLFFWLVGEQATREKSGWLIAAFGAATLLYIIPFVVNYPVQRTDTLLADSGLYFVGNLLTKIILPIVELWCVWGTPTVSVVRQGEARAGLIFV